MNRFYPKEFMLSYIIPCFTWLGKNYPAETDNLILCTSREFVNSKGSGRLEVNILSFIALIHKIL